MFAADPQIGVFVVASILVILIPGQDMVLVLSRGLTRGPRAGVLTAAGVSVGLLGHTLLAAMGLGALLLSSDGLFIAIKWIGAAYLAYLGVKLIRSASAGLATDGTDGAAHGNVFVEGLVSNIANPKITVFYFAFLPQFIDADSQQPAVELLLYGSAFALLTFAMKAPVGLFAGLTAAWIHRRPRVLLAINRVSGVLLISLALALALDPR